MLTPEQQIAKDKGIENALKAVPAEIEDAALQFYHAYAQVHYRFTSSEVLEGFLKRVGTVPSNGKGWRDSWGSITQLALKEHIMTHCGYGLTPQKHRHEPFGKLFESKVYTGDDKESYNHSDEAMISDAVILWRKGRERDPKKLAMMIYEMTYELAYTNAKADLLKKLNNNEFID
jgi:hypothetical protein